MRAARSTVSTSISQARSFWVPAFTRHALASTSHLPRAARVAKDELDRRLLESILRSRSVVDMAADVTMSLSGTHKRLQRIFRRAGVENQRALLAWLNRRR